MDVESECNCLIVRQAARQVTQLYDAELSRVGLRATQFAILQRVGLRDGATVQALATELVMDRSTLGHNLRPLERAELVTIGVDGSDRRARRVHITARGKRKLEAARKAWARAQQQFQQRVGKSQSHALRQQLRALIATLRD